MSLRTHQFIVWIAALLLSNGLLAQTTPPVAQDSSNSKIIIDNFLGAELVQKDGQELKKLSGQVLMHQGDAYMYCDTAYLIGENQLKAIGNVVITQGDSVAIFGDILNYDGAIRIADMQGREPVLVNGRQKLFAQKQLSYNLNTKIANYSQSALLDNGQIQLTSQKGFYEVNSKLARFYGNVVVVDSSFSLKTDSLHFNTGSQIAYFLTKTRIAQDSSKVYCEGGFYDTEQRTALFYDHAQYLKGEQKASADTIKYDGASRVTTLIGHAVAEEKDKKATANAIRFDAAQDITWLEGDANFVSDKQKVKGDSIRFDNKKQIFSSRGKSEYNEGSVFLKADQMESQGDTSLAIGNVVYSDSTQKTAIVTDRLEYQKSQDYFKAYGTKRPIFKAAIDNDTLYMSADTIQSLRKINPIFKKVVPDNTLTSAKDTTMPLLALLEEDTVKTTLDTVPIGYDTLRLLSAFYDVRIFKKDFQGRCDSLIYDTKDSLFRLFKAPVLWTDTISQLSADITTIRLKESKLHLIELWSKGLVISTKNEKTFDQIKADNINIVFEDGKIHHVFADKNSDSNYFILDDKEQYIGPNRVTASQMNIEFADSKVNRIKLIKKVSGKITPMKKADLSQTRVDGFIWKITQRIKGLEDL